MKSTARRHLGSHAACALVCALVVLPGCDKPRSVGDANQIVVGMPADLWATLEAEIRAALEPRTFTVRDENVFDVAYVEPSDAGWERLRMMRQVLLIGSADEPLVAEALAAHRGPAPGPPGVVQIRNVWAQNQLVTVALLPQGAAPGTARPLLPEVGEIYLQQFEEYARSRMFVTRPNEHLADSLRREAGFTLVLPQVYHYRQVEPDVLVFRNDQPDPSRLIRNITVASRPRGAVPSTVEAVSAWRAEIAERLTQPPQLTDAVAETVQLEVGGRSALQIQGVWSNPPGEWPAGGPFLARLIECPDRTFLVDAWLYAPGIAKYEYMYQLNTILNSFRCTGG